MGALRASVPWVDMTSSNLQVQYFPCGFACIDIILFTVAKLELFKYTELFL